VAEFSGSTGRLSIHAIRQACSTCSLADLCLPVALSSDDVAALDRIVQRRRPLAEGDALYRAGDRFSAIYAVRTGSLKASCVSEDGEEQITAFHLPGELTALDAITLGRHPSTALALETTSVCEIPFGQLEHLAESVPGLQRQLLRIMSREIVSEQRMLQTLGRRTAEQRLAIVLTNLGDRFARRGLAPDRFRLPMSRHDLGNYLGLAPETMSRLFKRFVERGWISAENREIELLDRPALNALSGISPQPSDKAATRSGLG
jgi:CRP/FNR family transcriptional regulator